MALSFALFDQCVGYGWRKERGVGERVANDPKAGPDRVEGARSRGRTPRFMKLSTAELCEFVSPYSRTLIRGISNRLISALSGRKAIPASKDFSGDPRAVGLGRSGSDPISRSRDFRPQRRRVYYTAVQQSLGGQQSLLCSIVCVHSEAVVKKQLEKRGDQQRKKTIFGLGNCSNW